MKYSYIFIAATCISTATLAPATPMPSGVYSRPGNQGDLGSWYKPERGSGSTSPYSEGSESELSSTEWLPRRPYEQKVADGQKYLKNHPHGFDIQSSHFPGTRDQLQQLEILKQYNVNWDGETGSSIGGRAPSQSSPQLGRTRSSNSQAQAHTSPSTAEQSRVNLQRAGSSWLDGLKTRDEIEKDGREYLETLQPGSTIQASHFPGTTDQLQQLARLKSYKIEWDGEVGSSISGKAAANAGLRRL